MYDETFAYSQDFELWARITSRFAVANLAAFLLRVREHPRSMTATYGDRTLEGERLRLATVIDALGWGQPAGAEQAARFRAMAALLHGNHIELTGQQALRAVSDVLALQAALCRRNGVQEIVARRHRRGVRFSISRGLVRLGHQCADQGRAADARQLLIGSWRVYPPGLARLSGARLAARLLQSASPPGPERRGA
jgi:hypothetical protein